MSSGRPPGHYDNQFDVELGRGIIARLSIWFNCGAARKYLFISADYINFGRVWVYYF